jgi:cobalamin biosynthesis protein CobT
MLTQAIEVMKYVRASAGRAGISVVFEHVNQPRHDGKTIFLPQITAATSVSDLQELMASVDHEVAHDRYSCFDVLKEKSVGNTSLLMFVWNFLEDSRINVIEAEEYKGFRDNWDETSHKIVQRILTTAKKEDNFMARLTTALICWETKLAAQYFPILEMTASRFTPNKELTDVLNNNSDRLIACHQILDKRLGTESTYELALDILKQLGQECKEEMKKAQEEAPKSSKSKKDSKKESKSSSEESTGKAGDESGGKGDGEHADSDEYKIVTITVDKDDLDKYSLSVPEEGREMGKIGINISEPASLEHGDWHLTDHKDFVVVDYPKNEGRSMYFSSSPVSDFIRYYNDVCGSSVVAQENFAQQVRKLIQIRAKVQTQYGVKKGKLDQSRLSRICFNTPGFNERVFKNKIENKTLDAAISVLVDMSGSMSGKKAYYALASTLLLNEVASTLNIPLEIVGFSDTTESKSDPLMFIYKSFSTLKVSSDDLKTSFAKSSPWMNGNPDGENILWAYDRLIKRKERKRILIVMSDGSPAATRSSYGIEHFTLETIREIEKSKKVDIYGLGLCSDSVRHYYKAHDVVNNPEEIPTKLISLIDRKVING